MFEEDASCCGMQMALHQTIFMHKVALSATLCFKLNIIIVTGPIILPLRPNILAAANWNFSILSSRRKITALRSWPHKIAESASWSP